MAKRVFMARRELGRHWPLAVLLGVWPLLGLGVLGGPGLWRGELPQLSVIALVTMALLTVVVREVGREPITTHGREATAQELETGLLLLMATYVLLSVTGGIRSFLYPIVYAAISFLVVVSRTHTMASILVLAAAALELTIGLSDPSPLAYRVMGLHFTFMGFFAIGNRLVLAGLVRRLRGDHDRRVDASLTKIRQEARDFRLIASSLPPQSRGRRREDEELRMAHAAVESIHEQLFHVLDLLRTTMDLHTCALVWCETDGPSAPKGSRAKVSLSLKEVATSSELVVEDAVLGGAGVLTSVIADPKPLRLHALGGKRLPPYYAGPEPVTDLCAVPLLERGNLRGILCADRLTSRPFDDDEVRVLSQAADHALRVIEHERTFTAVERSKYEQEQFFRSSELLNEALTLEQVYDRCFAAIKAIVPFDLAVITGSSNGGQEVLAVQASAGEWTSLATALDGALLTDPTSLVAIAVKNRHYVPAGGNLADPETVVLSAKTKLRSAKSTLVLPLVRGEQALGSITLAAAKPHLFPSRTREVLRVIGHQVGVSLQNARMYQSMETRATTDGLTGLTNHRSFQERLSQLSDLCERTGQKYALILTDIDHFKSVNDTYGHPVGDQVLKKVAAVFRGRARKVDIVARYGGEEFVLVLPDTNGEGAEHFANKLREEIGELVMTSENGSFKVTISMGVAEFPADGRDRLGLIEKADQALYYCKEHGRNCVRRWSKVGKG